MDKKLERILPLVQKPARYTGGEYGEIQKDKSEVDLRMALCFPDTYEIGMSNTGMRILYQVLNDLPGVWCERVFAPWFDMDRQMREKGLPLYALESGDPLSEFDAIGFSLGYEMAYTTVLEMLDLAGIPLRSAERASLTPLVFAGGSVCCNSEPMADFFDLMIIGDGREQLLLLPFCQRFFLGRLFPARLERARRILAYDVGVRGGGEDLLQRLHRVALAAAPKMRTRGHDVGDAVRRHLRHAQRADDRQNDRVELPGIMLAHLLGQARLPAGEPCRGVLPDERIRGKLFLRRPARAQLRDGEIALGDRAAVDVVILPVRALYALPV